MKKLFAILVAFVLVLTLCSCKNNNGQVANGNSLGESYLSSETSSRFESDGNTSTGTSSGQTTTSSTTTSSSSSSVASSSTGGHSNSSTPQNTVIVPVDTTRAPSTDVGSVISNGYIYYTNPNTSFPDGLFRKKISGGVEETVTNLYIGTFRVLNDTVYYTHGTNLYKCDTSGNNVKKLYDNILEFEVAGNWIFAKRYLGESSISRPKEELYAISTDGSVVKQIKPNVSNDAGSTAEIYGFNRGYCYISVTHYYFVQGASQPLTHTYKDLRLRIDYRSKDLVQQELTAKDNGTYQGLIGRYYVSGDNIIINDHVIFQETSKKIALSVLNNKRTTIYESQIALMDCALKDYLVYVPEEANLLNDKIVFVDYTGAKKTYTLDWSKYGESKSQIYYSFYHYQDMNNNSLLLTLNVRKGTITDYYLFIMDSNGQLTEIYKRTK